MGNFSGCAPIRVFSLVCEDQPYEKPKDVAAVRKPFQSAPGVPPELAKQPPAAPAATEAASLHLARRAPHPSADTSPGTEPSPRMPAMLTVPPRQKLVDEATSVKAVTLAADPSSLPVADLVVRRAASSWRKNLAFWPGFHLNRGEYTEGEGRETRPEACGPSLGEVFGKTPLRILLQRGEGFAKLADGGGYLPCSQPVVGD
jgi:hypothetical protein